MRKVTMSELKYIWATLRMHQIWHNGCTWAELLRICPQTIHQAGVGWLVPHNCRIFP